MVENRSALKFNPRRRVGGRSSWAQAGPASACGGPDGEVGCGSEGEERCATDQPIGDVLRESVAREQLEGPVHRELLGVPGRSLAADDHLALDFLDDEIADPSVGELADVRFDPLRPGWDRRRNHREAWCHSRSECEIKLGLRSDCIGKTVIKAPSCYLRSPKMQGSRTAILPEVSGRYREETPGMDRQPVLHADGSNVQCKIRRRQRVNRPWGEDRPTSSCSRTTRRLERAAPLEVEIGTEQGRGELVDSPGAEVRMLLAGLLHGEGGMPAIRQASSSGRRAPRSRPAWWTFSSDALIAASSTTGHLAGRQEIVQQFQCRTRLAGRGGVERLPDRLDPAGTDHPGDVRPLDPLRFARVDGELLHLGGQDADLQAHQLDQEVRRGGLRAGRRTASGHTGSATQRPSGSASRARHCNRSPGRPCPPPSPGSWSPSTPSPGAAGSPTRSGCRHKPPGPCDAWSRTCRPPRRPPAGAG